ncbi:ATP-binding cassette domain-containing protein [Comamonas sp. J-3]|uniref:ATP-binding cassette domain-containing protein n=1 Tax=Comamonas trifloxystrobinivorans TaxID=3350256 RepID=UPI00372BCA86
MLDQVSTTIHPGESVGLVGRNWAGKSSRFALLYDRLTKDGVLVLEIGNERDYFEAAFPGLPVFWMSTSAGDDQVLLLTHGALRHWSQEQPTQL